MSGIFGVVSEKKCSELLFYGVDYHSHLGMKYGGMAVLGREDIYSKSEDISHSQFKTRFYDVYKNMNGKLGIGVISGDEEQPIKMMSKFGEFAIVTNGRVYNLEGLVSELLEEGVSFSKIKKGKVNQTELVGNLIINDSVSNFVEGIERMYDRIEGSISLLLLSGKEKCIYAASDVFPLIVGKKDGALAITSETCAFPNLGFDVPNYLFPRQIMQLNKSGLKPKTRVSDLKQICSFLWIYTGFPASYYEGVNVEMARERCGRMLAIRDDVKADFVGGVPDSGTTHGIGYAMEAGIHFRRPLIKYNPGWGRSYIPPRQIDRDLIAYYKIIPIPEIIKGNNFVITEDSIVRGTQLRKLLKSKVLPYNPIGIHIRPACPPLMWPCKYNISTRSMNELAARKAIKKIEDRNIKNVSKYIDFNSKEYQKMVDVIADDLGATSLRYQTVDDMVEAIGLPKENLCLYCWTGK